MKQYKYILMEHTCNMFFIDKNDYLGVTYDIKNQKINV